MEREEKRKLTSTKWAPASLFRQFTWIDCSKIVTITKLCELAIAAIIIANTMDGNGNEHRSMNSQNHTQCTHTRITAHTDRIQMRLHVKIFQVRMKKQQNKYGAQSLLIGNFFLFAFTYWAIIYFLWGEILVCLVGEIVEKCTLTHWSVGFRYWMLLLLLFRRMKNLVHRTNEKKNREKQIERRHFSALNVMWCEYS